MTDSQTFFIVNKQDIAREISGGGDCFKQLEISIPCCFKEGNGVVSPVGNKEKFSISGYFDRARGITAFCSVRQR